MMKAEIAEIKTNEIGGLVSKLWDFRIGYLTPHPWWGTSGVCAEGEELGGDLDASLSMEARSLPLPSQLSII